MSHTPLSEHPHFEPWKDSGSGVTSHVLKSVAAPMQKAWYFVRPSIGASANILWFYACDPPLRKWRTAAISLDPQHPEVKNFPATTMTLQSGNGLLNEAGDVAWIPVHEGIYRFSFEGETEQVFRLPPSEIEGRHLFRLVTDLTLSSDGKNFLLDSWIGNQWQLGLADRETGEYTRLRCFGRDHHHGIFSSHDPDLFLINHGHWLDPYTGRKSEMDVRMWVMNTKLDLYQPLDPTKWFGRNSQTCHEWWSPEGKVQYCDYDRGIIEQDPLDHTSAKVIWDRPSTHGMVSPCGRYLVCDVNPYFWDEKRPCQVWFKDLESGREIPIVSKMPPHGVKAPDVRAYHLDPHPHFSADGQHVIYTTSAGGKMSVALASVSELLKAMDL